MDQRRAFRISALLGKAQRRAVVLTGLAGETRHPGNIVGLLADLEHELNALFEPPRGAGDGASTGANGPEQSAPIHEDRGARDHLGNPQCLECEMDTLSRESRYD
jgi:hypothetical protein